MAPAAAAVIGILGAYLVGSVPFGFLTARYVAGLDIRTRGSGNIGATNVGRVLGTGWGVLVLLLDFLKGLLPTLLLPRALLPADSPQSVHVQVGCGIAAVVGHMAPCWLRFRGGKGVATAAGVILVLAPWGTLTALGVFAVVFAAFRIVSLASVLAALGFAAFQMWRLQPTPFEPDHWTLGVFSLLVPLLILVRHRNNLARLLRGEEDRFQLPGRGGPQ